MGVTSAAPIPPSTPTRSFRASRLAWPTFVIAVVVILLDQGSKVWAEAALSDGQVIPVIGDLIRFVLVYNPGAAFSIGANFTWIFAVLAAAAVVFIVRLAWRVESIGWMIALGLLLGGATTHLGDRLFRAPGFARGHVVDFIGYGNLFIGNVADIAIFAGAIMLAVLTVMGVHMRPVEPVEGAPATAPNATDAASAAPESTETKPPAPPTTSGDAPS
ncbi:signal peptidase II [Cryobacterium arcticum]|uniref:Lipoprotein signal peptidase n=1 Tax=Cryobacterium arcticum TaxID=670052 RepID=A0A318A0K0_9MICO|nr:signal peptidase II [Cryobacterium arcticum]PXA71756.1 signal peptidase II [Cryobacterium arcticum]